MALDHQPPGQPMPWGGPPPGYYGPPPQHYVLPTSGLAVASLVCSLVGIFTFGAGAVAGVICGHLALPETRRGERGGHGLAIAGLVIGWIQCALWLLVLLFWLVAGLSVLGAAAGS